MKRDSNGELKMKMIARMPALFIAMCACVACLGEIRATKDLGNGLQLYQDNTTKQISIDGGNTWIELEQHKPTYYPSEPKRESKSDSADRLLGELRKEGRPTYVAKFGMGRKLEDDRRMTSINLMQQKTLDMKSSKEKDYDTCIRYVYFVKIDIDKMVAALKKYHASDSYRHSGNLYDYSTKPYGVFEIRTPIIVMKCWKKDYDELVVDVEHPITLKRGWLIDIDTLDGVLKEAD